MQVYLVGGAVRDQMLERIVKERDWVVVGATEAQMKAQGTLPTHALLWSSVPLKPCCCKLRKMSGPFGEVG